MTRGHIAYASIMMGLSTTLVTTFTSMGVAGSAVTVVKVPRSASMIVPVIERRSATSVTGIANAKHDDPTSTSVVEPTPDTK